MTIFIKIDYYIPAEYRGDGGELNLSIPTLYDYWLIHSLLI
jgi:hypothetical protein